MEKIIGIDLGTNSIGWAIRDISETENQIIDKGVLIFDKGVATIEGKEQPKVKVRTEARGKRRNYQAEKYRKWELLQCLIENKMCPLSIAELNEWRYYKKGVGRNYPHSKIFIQWLRFDFNGDGKPDFEQFGFSKYDNCYLFRWLAISENENHKKLFKENPGLLGRVLYQMVQRRGFKKNDGDDPETKLIEDGRENPITHEVEVVGIKVIDKLIKEKYKTLGAALYMAQKNNELESINNNRIRNRFTYRHYFETEIDLIFKNLGYDKFSEFCIMIKNAITWQRPLRSQKGLVGYCTLNRPLKSKTGIYYKPGKKRIPISHPLYEEYRTWCFINNLKIELPAEFDKSNFIETKVRPIFNRATDFYFLDKKDKNGKVTKGLKSKIEEEGVKILAKYDYTATEDDEGTRFNANTYQYKLEKIFGTNWKTLLKWDETVSGKEKSGNYLRAEDIWHLFYDALITKKQTDDLGKRLIPILNKYFTNIDFHEKDFEITPLDKGYASLSTSSIRKILPYLRQGMIYSQAVFVANLEKVFDKKIDAELQKNLTVDFNKILINHNSEKEVYRIVNDLISDRLSYRDRFNMGEDYQLDDFDKKDINDKINDIYKTKDWAKKTTDQKQKLIYDVSAYYLSFLRQPLGLNKSIHFLKVYKIEEKLIELLLTKYSADPNRIRKYLWHPSEQEKYSPANTKKDISGNVIKSEDGKEIFFLGDPNPTSKGFKNPMALKTLQILKKHLNYLLLCGKIDANTKIIIEIARELNDANRRKAIEKYQNERKRKNEGFKKAITEYFEGNNTTNKNISNELIDRYELWEEQTKKCLYCSQPISFNDVINGTAQLEHTIPAKLSNCSELFNLTLAHPHCNAKKAKRFPTQWQDNYELIKNNIKFIYAEFKKNEDIYKQTFESIKLVRDKKEQKDALIIKRHYHKILADYWRKKYETFTITEITSQFRRQQLTDTQIITKYCIPYLRTVFNRVDVQKGIITAKFRKIFQIEPKTIGEKNRSEHSHHAVDAAVLTLIPPASIRDNILKEYNEAIDNNTLNNYQHPKPKNWESFHHSFITSFKDELIINHLSTDRSIKKSFKYQRKRGEFVLIRDKNNEVVYQSDKEGNFIYHTDGKGNTIYKKKENGEFILDVQGEKIPVKKAIKKIQTGDTTRGKLHDESIFGMIKIPETEFKDDKYRLKITDGKLSFKYNKKRKDDLFVVKKIRITDFKSIEDFDKLVVDPNLGYYLKNEITRRMLKENLSFEKVLLQPIYAFGTISDKNGNPLQPIRHIKTKAKGKGGFVYTPPPIKEIEKAFESKRIHKRQTYAGNGEIPLCAFYEWYLNGKRERELKTYSILEVSNSFHFDKNNEIVEQRIFESKGKGKTKVEYTKELIAKLRPKQQVVFYRESLEELKELYISDKKSFSNRIYLIVKFDDARITFQHHLCSSSQDDINKNMEQRGLPKEGSSRVDFEYPILKLRLSQSALNMAIEQTHFEINLDGTIHWLK